MDENANTPELTEIELQGALAKLFKRSQTDVEFRNLCIADPHQAIFEVSGKYPPKDKPVKFVESEEASSGSGV